MAHTPEPRARRCRCVIFSQIHSPRSFDVLSRRARRPAARRVPGRPGRGAPEGRAPRESVSETATPRDVRLVSASVCHLLIVWRLSPLGQDAAQPRAGSQSHVSGWRWRPQTPGTPHTPLGAALTVLYLWRLPGVCAEVAGTLYRTPFLSHGSIAIFAV